MKFTQHHYRLGFISFCFILLLGVLLWRMFDLTILDRKFLQGQGNARSIRVMDTPGYRGIIMDRHGSSLAVSAPVKSLWVNPKEFQLDSSKLSEFSELLNVTQEQLIKRLDEYKNREFLYLKRHLTPAQANQIEDLKILGLNFQDEYKRYYPEAESTAQLLGFTDIDDNGIEGLELLYNNWLKGESGKKRVVKDRKGSVVEELNLIKSPRQGNDIRLSIDRRIQYLAYEQLKETIDRFCAKSGSVIVLDSKTGEILAMVNAPSFNPNARGRYSSSHFRNKSVTDVFEPGSVIKPFSIASALQSGIITKDSVIDTYPGWMNVQGKLIRDIKNYGTLDVSQILQHSSNVGVSKIILANPAADLINVFANVGYGQRSELAYPGEGDGTLLKPINAKPFALATLGFGYGLSLNALQLARSYSIFANGGRLLPISLLTEKNTAEKQVISSKVADEVLLMMESVLDNTHKIAKVADYRVAGKTGTARIAGKSGYTDVKHIASFAGIAPVSDPRLIVVVVIHEPTKIGYYAGQVAAPLFTKIMGTALHILEIPPDALTSTENVS